MICSSGLKNDEITQVVNNDENIVFAEVVNFK